MANEKAPTAARATKLIDAAGILLVFPAKGKADVPSLWSALYPNVPMRWEWDNSADSRVVQLWHLREQLASSREVAYAKWFQGRATFFSLRIFGALLADFHQTGNPQAKLPREARDILDLLLDNSPQSTKQIREGADLRGKAAERLFTHAMKALWARLLVVGVGEVDDGAFPSLAVAATETWFEDAWQAREDVDGDAAKELAACVAKTPAFARELAKSRKLIQSAT